MMKSKNGERLEEELETGTVIFHAGVERESEREERRSLPHMTDVHGFCISSLCLFFCCLFLFIVFSYLLSFPIHRLFLFIVFSYVLLVHS